jgi:hypothetical protein
MMVAATNVVELGAINLQELEDEILELRNTIADSTMRLGALLKVAKDLRAYESWGFTSWKEWVETKVDMGERKARSLIAINRWFTQECDPSVLEKLHGIGWSKLSWLVGIVTEKNVDDWAERIQTMTLDQVIASVRDLKKGQDPDVTGSADIASKTFRLYPAQSQVVEDALKVASGVTKSDKQGYNLEMLAASYLTGHALEQEVAPGPKKMEAYLQQIADSMNINIVGFHRDSHRVIAGRDLVPDIVDGLSEKGVGRLVLKIAESGVLDKLQVQHRRALWEYLNREFGS